MQSAGYCDHQDQPVATNATGTCHDILLSTEDRYQIWLAKATERPDLLETYESGESGKVNETSSGSTQLPLPLIDGCDIAYWRRERVVDVSRCEDAIRVLESVGPGSALLRRETQLPLLNEVSFASWERLKQRLMQPTLHSCNVRRISYQDSLTEKTLHPWFERKNVPVLLEGYTNGWKAMQTFQFSCLVQRFGTLPWRLSDTHGETLTLHLYQKYLANLEGQTDDAPLAIYDSQFHLDERQCLLQHYTVPAYFSNDLFEVFSFIEEKENQTVPSKRASPEEAKVDKIDTFDPAETVATLRPPFRWILIGPSRSGTGLHIDPVGTHAWVALIQGCKRWVLFPYGTPPEDIHMQQPPIPSVVWFRDYYETICIQKKIYHVEILQRPGEIIYVPAGWPHVVLNLELSVAVTHNYASSFPSVERLRDACRSEHPELAQALSRLNLPEIQMFQS